MNNIIAALIGFLILLTGSNSYAQNRVSGAEEWYLPTEDTATELYVYEMGAGEPVVVVHGGFGAEHSYLLDAVAGLEGKFRFIFYDQRGSLRSPSKPESISIDKHIEDLESLRKAAGLEKMTIFAHSMGTYLAMLYLQRYPDRVKNLVLTGAIPSQSGRYLDPSLLASMNNAGQEFRRFAERPEKVVELEKVGYKQPNKTAKQETYIWRINFAAGNIYHVERWRTFRGGRIFYSQEAGRAAGKTFSNDYDFLQSLSSHPYPVTFINGDHDLADFGNVFYKNFAGRVPKIELVILRKAGHNSWTDAPKEFSRALNKALNKRSIPGRK